MKACEKATYLKEKSTMSKLTLWEKFVMNFHFFMCPPCKKYGHDSEKMNATFKKCRQDKKFPEASKKELKDKLH
jgi:hypothetical protein